VGRNASKADGYERAKKKILLGVYLKVANWLDVTPLAGTSQTRMREKMVAQKLLSAIEGRLERSRKVKKGEADKREKTFKIGALY